jgi:hypothetical protein
VIFISHSSKDKSIADAICNQLESAGIPCWIAPRDIEVGSDWTRGVMQGIAKCRVFVLVFTDHANDSEHVGREVANAFSLGLAVKALEFLRALEASRNRWSTRSVFWTKPSGSIQSSLSPIAHPLKHTISSTSGMILPQNDAPWEMRR